MQLCFLPQQVGVKQPGSISENRASWETSYSAGNKLYPPARFPLAVLPDPRPRTLFALEGIVAGMLPKVYEDNESYEAYEVYEGNEGKGNEGNESQGCSASDGHEQGNES